MQCSFEKEMKTKSTAEVFKIPISPKLTPQAQRDAGGPQPWDTAHFTLLLQQLSSLEGALAAWYTSRKWNIERQPCNCIWGKRQPYSLHCGIARARIFSPFGLLEYYPNLNLTSAYSVDTWQLPAQAEMMACSTEMVHTENECTQRMSAQAWLQDFAKEWVLPRVSMTALSLSSYVLNKN